MAKKTEAEEKNKEAEEPQESAAEAAKAEPAQSEEPSVEEEIKGFSDMQAAFDDLAKDDDIEESVVEEEAPSAPEAEVETPAKPEKSAAEGEDEPKLAEEPKAKEQPEPKPEEAKPGEQPKPEEKKPAEAVPPQQEPVVPAAREEPAQTPEEFEQTRREHRKLTVEKLADEHFALDEETKAAFGEEAAKAISRLQAKTFLDSVENAALAVMQVLPQAIAQVTATQRSDQELETQFFAAWPKLDKSEHGDTIRRLANSYRNANPKMDTETFIRDVGAQAMVALKIELPNTVTKAPEEPEQPAKPTPPVSQGGPGGKPPQEKGFYEQLADEDIAEEMEGF